MNDDNRKTVRIPTPNGVKEVSVPTIEELHGMAQGADCSNYRDRHTEEDVAKRIRLAREQARNDERLNGTGQE
ncbi:hypothetical protein QCN27_19855 [Cereibacter sp. SYSU M97828]|nr:hypothetical protein [Cereibacter flavus]